jgi:hypothetical protein
MPSVAASSSSAVVESEAGSQTTEYALVMILAATIAALALAWARNGAVAGLLDTVLQQVRGMLGIG